MPRLVALIPARWQSSRFPGKPLADLLGKPMIEHVYQRALLIPKVTDVFVATDEPKIAQAVEKFGGQALMTRADHPSGSDRLAEAADFLGLAPEDIIINVQGDQPAFDPNHPGLIAQALAEDPGLEMATLAIPMTDPEAVKNPNHVKVVFDENQMALYFSRSPIPFPRDCGEGQITYYRHIGLYAYRAGFLRQYVKVPPSRLETIEKLEQLRVLESGRKIKVLLADGLSPEVDCPQDLEAAKAALGGSPQNAQPNENC